MLLFLIYKLLYKLMYTFLSQCHQAILVALKIIPTAFTYTLHYQSIIGLGIVCNFIQKFEPTIKNFEVLKNTFNQHLVFQHDRKG